MNTCIEINKTLSQQICGVTADNVDKYLNRIDGNIYYRLSLDSAFELLESGFTADEIKAAIGYGDADFIFISGSAEAGLLKLKELESGEQLQSLLRRIFEK